MERYICVHGHFYQPPRENPWLEEVELQESASPFHDWNERITAECYAPNTASRILDHDRRIVDIVNNYSKISFNFGPTLLSWMERHQPDIYAQILEADKLSQERFSGHGSALAQVYNHMIVPLATEADKRTQILWGIRDFQARFERDPEGMWLPETAVDLETLDILAEMGIRFTVLSPYQAEAVRPSQEEEWIDVQGGTVDPTKPYLCWLPSGRSIALFFYDGPISQDIAFGGLLNNGEAFAERLTSAFTDDADHPQLGHVATDGETYGHHHRMGDMALAYCLYHLEEYDLARLTVYGEFLEKHPPEWEARIVENSSWSCVHGIERWRGDCGCHSGMRPGWTQAWRKPLREAMDMLRESVAKPYETLAGKLLKDPWQARDDFIEIILDRSEETVERFLADRATKELSSSEKVRALKLLELQRHAMLIFTSCGWFFDEISGIETTQVMRYAARLIQLAREVLDLDLEEPFLDLLDQAPSNIAKLANGRRVYKQFVRPAQLDFLFVGSHYALSSLFEPSCEDVRIYCYTVDNEIYKRSEAGQLQLAIGRSTITSNITWDSTQVSFAAAYIGDHNANCGIMENMPEQDFQAMRSEVQDIFARGDIPELIRSMDRHFPAHNYTLWHLFKDEQQKVLQEILASSLEELYSSFRQALDHHYPLLNFLSELNSAWPRAMAVTAETIINEDLQNLFQKDDQLDLDELERLLSMAQRWEIPLSGSELGFKAGWRIAAMMKELLEEPEDLERIEAVISILEALQPFDLDLNLWESQNILFYLVSERYDDMEVLSRQGDQQADRWLERIQRLAEFMKVSIS